MKHPKQSENIERINHEIRVFARMAAKYMVDCAAYRIMRDMRESRDLKSRYDELVEKWVKAGGSSSREGLHELHEKVRALADGMICLKEQLEA